jgi:hypothetical protein
MAVLTPQQRNTLEAAVKQARKVAEQGAFNALHGMAVDHPEPFAHMTPEQRNLRNNLRSKARLLGDVLPASGNKKLTTLVTNWRMKPGTKCCLPNFWKPMVCSCIRMV